MGNDIKSLEVHEFICRFKESIGKKNAKFCFFLGAGCSVSSGIPTAGEIVNNIWIPMLRGLKAKNKENFETWFKNRFPEYDESIAALFYGEIIEELFPYPKERQQEIERLVAEKDPGFGYAILAQLLAEKCGERCNIILTTNFDDMIADALYLYTNKKPIIVSHEALVGFIKISDTRPLVIKLHGDSKFFPLNTPRETKELNDNIKKVMKTLFSETGLIFIGYGGNDKSIIEILKEVPNDESFFQWGIYWIGQKLPTNEMGEFLTNRNAIWVNHRDFDELMLLLKDEFGFKLPTEDRFKKLFYTNFKTFQELEGKIHTKLDSIEKDTLEKAFEETSKEFASMTPLLNEELLKHSKTNFNNFCEEYRKKTKKILIIGDVFLNHTLVGIQAKYSDVQKHTIISRGGGVYTVNVETETLGGAAYLALALSEISHVILISVIGLDHEGNTLIKKCKDHKIQFNPIETIEVKTTTRAYINQLADDCDRGVLRFDNEDIKSMTRYCNSENVQDTIINKIKEYTNSIDCIVIKDYEKGVISEKLVKKIAEISRNNGIPLYVDPNYNWDKFKDVRIEAILPNVKEAASALYDVKIDEHEILQRDVQCELMKYDYDILVKKHPNCENFLIKASSKGSVILSKSGDFNPVIIRPFLVNWIDFRTDEGCGDVLDAFTIVGMLDGHSLEESVLFANFVAGIKTKKSLGEHVYLNDIKYELGNDSFNKYIEDNVPLIEVLMSKLNNV